MNPRLRLLLFLAGSGAAFAADPKAVVAPAAAAARPDATLAPSASFEAFRTIGDRNIFNPFRTGRRDRSEEPAPQADTLTFVGTMNSDRGLVVFFDGSSPVYRKVLRVGESVADFKVTTITADRVELDHGGKTILMRLPQQLRRPVGADWSLSDVQIVSEAPASAVDPAAPPVISASDDDVVKRMKERRAKELKQ